MPRYPLPTHYLHRFVVTHHAREDIQEWLAANSSEPHGYHIMSLDTNHIFIVWISSDDLAMRYKLTWV